VSELHVHTAEVTSLGHHIHTRFSRLTGHFCSFSFQNVKHLSAILGIDEHVLLNSADKTRAVTKYQWT